MSEINNESINPFLFRNPHVTSLDWDAVNRVFESDAFQRSVEEYSSRLKELADKYYRIASLTEFYKFRGRLCRPIGERTPILGPFLFTDDPDILAQRYMARKVLDESE